MRLSSQHCWIGVLLLASLVVCGPGTLGENESDVGRLAPQFTLQDLDGNEIRLSDYRGKIVLLTFWGSGCKEALDQQMPTLQQQIYDVYDRKQVEIFSIHIGMDPDLEQLRACRDEKEITFPILVDGLRTSMEYSIFATPNLIVIGGDGMIRHREVRQLFSDEARVVLEKLVAELEMIGVQVGQKAPDFSLPLLGGEESERVNLYEQVEQHDVTLLFLFLAAT